MANITEIARDHGFKGTKQHKWSDLGTNSNYTIDHSGAGRKNNIYTSVDCYVSGSYLTGNGATLEIKQRYTVNVSYNRDTMDQAMNDLRHRIIQDFSSNFPDFRITDVFIPDAKFIKPTGDEGRVEDLQFYRGSEMFKNISRMDVAQYKMHIEGDIYKANIQNIKKRYGII